MVPEKTADAELTVSSVVLSEESELRPITERVPRVLAFAPNEIRRVAPDEKSKMPVKVALPALTPVTASVPPKVLRPVATEEIGTANVAAVSVNDVTTVPPASSRFLMIRNPELAVASIP